MLGVVYGEITLASSGVVCAGSIVNCLFNIIAVTTSTMILLNQVSSGLQFPQELVLHKNFSFPLLIIHSLT